MYSRVLLFSCVECAHTSYPSGHYGNTVWGGGGRVWPGIPDHIHFYNSTGVLLMELYTMYVINQMYLSLKSLDSEYIIKQTRHTHTHTHKHTHTHTSHTHNTHTNTHTHTHITSHTHITHTHTHTHIHTHHTHNTHTHTHHTVCKYFFCSGLL